MKPHPVPREDRGGTICEDYELYGCSVDRCPERCYLALPDPTTEEEHDDHGCDHVIEVGGYEYICNCAQTPTEIRNYLRDKAS